jgi:hypothetical protein
MLPADPAAISLHRHVDGGLPDRHHSARGGLHVDHRVGVRHDLGADGDRGRALVAAVLALRAKVTVPTANLACFRFMPNSRTKPSSVPAVIESMSYWYRARCWSRNARPCRHRDRVDDLPGDRADRGVQVGLGQRERGADLLRDVCGTGHQAVTVRSL